MMALFVLVCIHQWLHTARLKSRVLWATLGALAFISITHLSNGRTGYLSLLLSLTVYGLTIIHRPRKWLWVSAASLVFVLLISTSTVLSHRFHSVISDVQSYNKKSTGDATLYQITPSGARLSMWKLSVSQMAKQPLIGAGTGAYHSIAKQEFTDPELCRKNCVHPHNQFLFFGVEYGLVGIIAYLFYFYRPYKFAQTLSRPKKSLLLGFLSILFVDSMTHGALWLSVESHFFAFIMALLMSLHSNPEMKKEP
jgi:O-antigen ligase